MEKRRHQRLPIRLPAELSCADGRLYPLYTANLSFGGGFLSFEREPDVYVGECCGLRIYLDADEAEPHLNFTVTVAHVLNEGVGVHIMATDLESYDHFKNLIVARSPAPAALLEELAEYPVCFGEKTSG